MSDYSKLKKAYMNAADKQIKESNRNYDDTISQANTNALVRGMGRSSYALQTSANLENQKLETASQIKSDANDAFIQAWLAYKQQQEQIQLQREQFEWEKQQAAASASAYGGSGNPGSNPGKAGDDSDVSAFRRLFDKRQSPRGAGDAIDKNANIWAGYTKPKNIWEGYKESLDKNIWRGLH